MSGHTNIIGCEVIQLAKDTTLLTEIGGGVIAIERYTWFRMYKHIGRTKSYFFTRHNYRHTKHNRL